MGRFQVTPAVFLMLIEKEKVLLLLREGTGYMDGYYSFVAGHMDGDETVKEAMMRESLEEANIKVTEQDLEVSLVMHRFSSDERVDFFLTAKSYEGPIKNLEPSKCKELKWFDIKDLPKNMVPNVRCAIESYYNNKNFVEFDDRIVNL